MSPKSPLATVKIVLITLLTTGIVGLAAYGIYSGKLNLPFNTNGFNLEPARDLRGTWVSSLSGKGFQLNGKFVAAGATTTVYEDGDIELIIDNVENGQATGTIRYFNICAWGFTIAPVVGKVSVPEQCVSDSGAQPITIGVSSSALDFGAITTDSVVATMRGSFTTDLIHGTMTATIAPYGEVKGFFNLHRKRE